jgi:type I restriction enzyme M protein
MSTQSSTIIQRLWTCGCNVLHDDGMSYGDYIEQLTCLLFLKMDQEGSAIPGLPGSIPDQFNRGSLQRLDVRPGAIPILYWQQSRS